MSAVMMKCGHASQAVDGNGNPACIICIGIDPGATVVDDSPPPMVGRAARCTYYGQKPGPIHAEGPCGRETCHCEQPSAPALAFFEYKADAPFDRYYCGCAGWD